MSNIRLHVQSEKTERNRLRIAVALDDEGNWIAHGGSDCADEGINDILDNLRDEITGDAQQQFWLVVDLPVPQSEVLAGVVENGED